MHCSGRSTVMKDSSIGNWTPPGFVLVPTSSSFRLWRPSLSMIAPVGLKKDTSAGWLTKLHADCKGYLGSSEVEILGLSTRTKITHSVHDVTNVHLLSPCISDDRRKDDVAAENFEFPTAARHQMMFNSARNWRTRDAHRSIFRELDLPYVG